MLSKYFSDKATRVYQDFNSRFVETVDGIKIIKVFGQEENAKIKFHNGWNDYLRRSYHLIINSNLLRYIQQPITVGVISLVILIAVRNFKMSFSSLSIFLLISYRLFPAINSFVNCINNISSLLPPIGIAIDSMSRENKPYLRDGDEPFEKFKTSISFKNITFSYVPGTPVIKNVSFEIKKNSMVALVGSTGSGKSTLVDLFLRLYDPDNGEICIDSVDLKRFKIDTLRKNVSVVFQDVFLFNETIRDNILFGNPDASQDDVMEAAISSNADKFIQTLPIKYDTIVGERGITLSGGQKQMISLARALLRKPQILILDEATSSLDNQSERLIQNAVEKLSQSLTMIVIAHRLSTIINADKIIVIEKGRIVEEGTHKNLLKNGSYYSQYYHLQFT